MNSLSYLGLCLQRLRRNAWSRVHDMAIDPGLSRRSGRVKQARQRGDEKQRRDKNTSEDVYSADHTFGASRTVLPCRGGSARSLPCQTDCTIHRELVAALPKKFPSRHCTACGVTPFFNPRKVPTAAEFVTKIWRVFPRPRPSCTGNSSEQCCYIEDQHWACEEEHTAKYPARSFSGACLIALQRCWLSCKQLCRLSGGIALMVYMCGLSNSVQFRKGLLLVTGR